MSIRTRIQRTFRALLYRFRVKRYGLYFPIACKAHGVTSHDYQGAIAQSRSGDRLQLVHVAQKDYPFNVFIYSVNLNRLLGYLHNDLAKSLVKTFGKGFCLDGVIDKITGGKPRYEYFGCNIRIFDTKAMMQNVDISSLYEA